MGNGGILMLGLFDVVVVVGAVARMKHLPHFQFWKAKQIVSQTNFSWSEMNSSKSIGIGSDYCQIYFTWFDARQHVYMRNTWEIKTFNKLSTKFKRRFEQSFLCFFFSFCFGFSLDRQNSLFKGNKHFGRYSVSVFSLLVVWTSLWYKAFSWSQSFLRVFRPFPMNRTQHFVFIYREKKKKCEGERVVKRRINCAKCEWGWCFLFCTILIVVGWMLGKTAHTNTMKTQQRSINHFLSFSHSQAHSSCAMMYKSKADVSWVQYTQRQDDVQFTKYYNAFYIETKAKQNDSTKWRIIVLFCECYGVWIGEPIHTKHSTQ